MLHISDSLDPKWTGHAATAAFEATMTETPAWRSSRVERQRLKFAAAHMATFAGSMEPLHGHNYALTLEVEGSLADEGWVMDFGVLKRIGRDICDELDHHFLLQAAGDRISILRSGEIVELRFGEKRYQFPAEDIYELPIANTTTELLAEWLWHRVQADLTATGMTGVLRLTVGVEEAPGQAGWFSAPMQGNAAE
jgi:6-pyruvoyltetrahydropterin/6-carboxytetrahydropterin synthase